MIKIDFTKTDGTYTYTDSLSLPDDHTFTEEEIENMKEQRFQNWLNVINTPPETPVEGG